jgi:Kef-type K+ transport system membrane component KefB
MSKVKLLIAAIIIIAWVGFLVACIVLSIIEGDWRESIAWGLVTIMYLTSVINEYIRLKQTDTP